MFYHLNESVDNFNEELIVNIQNWCDENLKNGEVIVGATTIYIESEIDAMAFKLRWIT